MENYASANLIELFINLKRFYGLIKLYKSESEQFCKAGLPDDAMPLRRDKIFVVILPCFRVTHPEEGMKDDICVNKSAEKLKLIQMMHPDLQLQTSHHRRKGKGDIKGSDYYKFTSLFTQESSTLLI
jgi:hypothetical protein